MPRWHAAPTRCLWAGVRCPPPLHPCDRCSLFMSKFYYELLPPAINVMMGIAIAWIPAYECAKIMQNPWKKLVLGQIDYVTTFLTLHTDADATVAKPHFAPAQNSSVLYYVDDETMTGKIGQIFGKSDSDLLLTVHADQEVIRSEKVKTQYAWTHHFFSLWELAISRRFVPMFDADHGLYFAGDWMQGPVWRPHARQEFALNFPKDTLHEPGPRQLYRNLLLDICLDSAPLAESERNPKSR
eukprot:g33622.t1